jgi:drug/metabolite transporter (DMT)-like permease
VGIDRDLARRPSSNDGTKDATRDVEPGRNRGDSDRRNRAYPQQQQEEVTFDLDLPAAAPFIVTDEEEDRTRGLMVLLTVPLAWGTFEPAVRFVYSEGSDPIPPFVFSLLYYSVAAATLLGLAAAVSAPNKFHDRPSPIAPDNSAGTAAAEEAPFAGDSSEEAWPIRGGVELGTYLFVGNALQLLGLQTIASDRAAFLLQLTTLFVPLAEAAASRSLWAVSGRLWVACLLALLRVFVMGLDGTGEASASDVSGGSLPTLSLTKALATVSLGDLCVVGAAVAYTFHCIRLEPYAKATSAVKLAACKAVTETLWTVLSVFGFVAYYYSHLNDPGTGNVLSQFALESGRDITSYIEAAWNGFVDLSQRGDDSSSVLVSTLQARVLPTAVAVLWTGWVTVAYTIYAQSYGQRRVPPVTANLIYTIQPVCTAVVAWLVLGETLGPAGYAGGTLIGAAVLLVTTATAPPTASDKNA